jgi:superfamily II DNA or RNA helicase
VISFAGDPAIWLDEKAGVFGLIDTGLAHDVAARLLALPPVAAADIEPLARRWPDLVGDAIPAPALDDVADITTPPRPVLHFMIDKLDCLVADRSWYRERYQQSRQSLVRLSFDYGGHRVMAPEAMAEVFARGQGGVMRIRRDLEVEQAAADRLAMTALRPLEAFGGVRPKPHQRWDHALPVGEGSYPDLLVNQIADLEREGWLIDHAPDWPHIHHPIEEATPGLELSPAQGAHMQAGLIDWFDVELPALVKGARVDILPALRQMLAEAGEALLQRDDGHQLALPLDGGGFTTIALGAVRPLLEALLRLALSDRQASSLRLSRHDLGLIHELSSEGVAWTNADALRRLALALHDPYALDYAAPAGLSADLRSYQRSGVVWLKALHAAGLGGILADDMGLGKTLQAIAHILQVRQAAADRGEGNARVLIVAPTSVLPNWQAEIARFAPEVTLLLWHGADRRQMEGELEAADVVLTSYPLLARDKEMLSGRDYALAVLDEAHVLKNPATAGFKAAAALISAQTVALTGTPLENRLTDIWALASLTNPGLLGTLDGFRKTYRTPIEKQGDAVARDALARRLRPFMLRRTKDEVASELPPKTLIPERIDLLDAQQRLYESQRLLMQERVRQEIDRVGLMRSQIIVLDAMLKLRQICCDPSLLPDGRGEGVASAKRARVLEMVPELVREGRRVIIFSQFTAMLDRLSADLAGEGIDHEHLRGSTRDRAKPVRRFQKHEVAVILVSLKAGGAGVNLTAADTVILYDPWWNPAVEAQAIDRAHRIGQTKPVFVHRMIATGTIEDKILALQERKRGWPTCCGVKRGKRAAQVWTRRISLSC